MLVAPKLSEVLPCRVLVYLAVGGLFLLTGALPWLTLAGASTASPAPRPESRYTAPLLLREGLLSLTMPPEAPKAWPRPKGGKCSRDWLVQVKAPEWEEPRCLHRVKPAPCPDDPELYEHDGWCYLALPEEPPRSTSGMR